MDLVPILTPVQHLGEYIREQRTAAQISVRSLAARAGVSNPYLSQVERGLRRPSAGVLAQIAKGLSISTETLLVKAGILSASGAGPVVAAIRADPHLDEHHKSALIDVYVAFRRESDARTDDGRSAPTASPTAAPPTAAPPTAGSLDGPDELDLAETSTVAHEHDTEQRKTTE